jgi:hypothetical protein
MSDKLYSGLSAEGFAQKVASTIESAFSGRLKIAQRFIAGSAGTETKSVKRTAEKMRGSGGYHSVVRFAD